MAGPRNQRTDAVLLEELGARLARERLSRNWTQAELARRAGVSRPTVARMEAGSSSQLTNLVRVLRALGLEEQLGLLVPEPDVRPLQALERGSKGRRRRATGRRGRRGRAGAGDGEPTRPWRWGEDR